eukprot:scaffold36353_cov64-Phaeocystis_antarctica.AAC.3
MSVVRFEPRATLVKKHPFVPGALPAGARMSKAVKKYSITTCADNGERSRGCGLRGLECTPGLGKRWD